MKFSTVLFTIAALAYAFPLQDTSDELSLYKRTPQAKGKGVGKKGQGKKGKGQAKKNQGKKGQAKKNQGKKGQAKKNAKGKGKGKNLAKGKGKNLAKGKGKNLAKGKGAAKGAATGNAQIDALQQQQDAAKAVFDDLTLRTATAAQNARASGTDQAFQQAIQLDTQKDIAEAKFDTAKKATEAAKKAAGL
jgi:hypothetical protein